jgi:hypothetical protein
MTKAAARWTGRRKMRLQNRGELMSQAALLPERRAGFAACESPSFARYAVFP